jgi:hypothetical protein
MDPPRLKAAIKFDAAIGTVDHESTRPVASGPRSKTLGVKSVSHTHARDSRQIHLVPPAIPLTPLSAKDNAQSVVSSSHSIPTRSTSGLQPSDRFRDFEPFVDERVVATFLGLTPRRILELARECVISSHPIGHRRKTWRFRISEVAADLEHLKTPARANIPAAVPGTKERNQLG